MKELEKLIIELEDRFNRWEHLKKHGGQDPFWSDGCNMGLIRNHILHFKRQIEELCEEKGLELPDIYYKETPTEIDKNYMARVDEIRKNANRALREYKANKDYQYLLGAIHKLNKSQMEQTAIGNVINYCKCLENHIKNDDLIAMRRHERWEHYTRSFWDCRKKVEKVLIDVQITEKEEHIQIRMF